MASIRKKLAKPVLDMMLKAKYHIHISGGDMDYRMLRSGRARGTKENPILIVDSKIGNIGISEGCRLFDCVCTGHVTLDRFVTLAGPGVKICGNVLGIEIGGFTSIGANVVVQEGEHDMARLTTYFINRNLLRNAQQEEISRGKIVIQEGVWIGSNSVIRGGVLIGRGAVIGAGSVVTRDIPPYSVCVGVPCRPIKKRFSDAVIEKIERSAWWTLSIEQLKQHAGLFAGHDFLSELDQLYRG